MNRLEILQQSLEKKQRLLNDKIAEHFATVRRANGQPLNDKRNGRATLDRWEQQNEAIRNLQNEIEKTQRAIEIETGKIANVERANGFIPAEILALIECGQLQQWRKHPHIFFVPGVDKARIIWDEKRKIVAHKFVSDIINPEQRAKFAGIFNSLRQIFNVNKYECV